MVSDDEQDDYESPPESEDDSDGQDDFEPGASGKCICVSITDGRLIFYSVQNNIHKAARAAGSGEA